MHYLLLLIWAVCVCLAFQGYGTALLTLCKSRNQPWALAGCLGTAVVAAMGGILEITGSVRTPILMGLVLTGDTLLVRALLRNRSIWKETFSKWWGLLKSRKAVPVLLLLLLILAAIRLLGNLEPRYFQLSDDLGAYLSFPTEMLQLGSLPSDPFSERRIQSSLGGSYFLQTLTMVASDARSIRFVDWGFGSVLYLGIVFAIGRRLKLSVTSSLALALLTFLIPLRRQNATMLVLPAALFCSLFLLELPEERNDLNQWLRPMLLGLLGGTICILKSSYLPAAVSVCGLYYGAEILVQRRRSALLQSGVCALVAALSVLPWMLDQKKKEGTYLFPILGRGYEASAYGLIPLPGGTGIANLSPEFWMSVLPMLLPFLLAVPVGLIARRQLKEPAWLAGVTFFLAICGGVVAVALGTGGDSVARYTMPFVAPGVIVFFAYALRWRSQAANRPVWITGALAFCTLWVFAAAVRYGIQTDVYRDYLTDLGFPSIATEIVQFDADSEKGRVAALQASVPVGQPILEHLFVSYPLDFKRNQIFIADFPGLAGSPPGMPIGKGPSQLRRYLLDNSIRFVAFTYGRGRIVDLTPALSLQQLLTDSSVGGRHTWLYIQNKVSLNVQSDLTALAKKYPHTYDDGEACVVDLQVPVA